MAWIFISLAILFVALAFGYYKFDAWRDGTDYCSEAVAGAFDFLADFFRDTNLPIPTLLLAALSFGVGIYCFKSASDTSSKESSAGAGLKNGGGHTAMPTSANPARVLDPPNNEPLKWKAETREANMPDTRVVQTIPIQLVDESSLEPIAGARVEVGQNKSYSDSNGIADVPVNRMTSPGTIVKIARQQYVTVYLTRERVLEAPTVYCRKKHRLIVVDWEYPKATSPARLTRSEFRSLRKRMEERFSACEEIELLAESLRDRVVKELFKVQRDRALYDPETIAKIGDFLGATHAVFGEMGERNSGEIEVKAYYVDLGKAMMLTSEARSVPERDQLDALCSYVADLLVSHFTRIHVLWPASGSECGRNLRLEGHILFRPWHSHVWLSVLPEGSHLHYPQLPITVQEDGRWTASSVSIGDDDVRAGSAFDIKPILADPVAHQVIDAYLERIRIDPSTSPGMDLAKWERERRCRIYEGIRVVRVR